MPAHTVPRFRLLVQLSSERVIILRLIFVLDLFLVLVIAVALVALLLQLGELSMPSPLLRAHLIPLFLVDSVLISVIATFTPAFRRVEAHTAA